MYIRKKVEITGNKQGCECRALNNNKAWRVNENWYSYPSMT